MPKRMKKLYLGLGSFKNHMTSETHQLQLALKSAGWTLAGPGLDYNTTDVQHIVNQVQPDIVIITDKREWDDRSLQGGREAFTNLDCLSELKLVGIIKDAHWFNPKKDIICDRYICYYDPNTVARLASVPVSSLTRTYHSIDRYQVPVFSSQRDGSILSGALNPHYYPLRHRLSTAKGTWHVMQHPGYHENGTHSVTYLEVLNKYKVSICTASMYGYLLRKIIESTACGCRVITNLREKVPYIDDNLIRVSDDVGITEVQDIIYKEERTYDAERQEAMAKVCKQRYDYREQGILLDKELCA